MVSRLMSQEPRIPNGPGETETDKLARNDYGRYAGLGFSFAITIIAFSAIGWWVDGKLGTTPLLLIVGVFVGFGGGLMSIIKRVPPARRRPAREGQSATSRNSQTSWFFSEVAD